jgi:single-strand DNA-binding protein
LMFYNKVILIGNLAKDPDSRFTPSGNQVTRLVLQIRPERDSGGFQDAQVIEVVAFEEDPHPKGITLSKGSWVLVEGRIETRSWKTVEGQKRHKLEIMAERIHPFNNKKPIGS